MRLWKEMEGGVLAWEGSTEIQLGQVNPVAAHRNTPAVSPS